MSNHLLKEFDPINQNKTNFKVEWNEADDAIREYMISVKSLANELNHKAKIIVVAPLPNYAHMTMNYDLSNCKKASFLNKKVLCASNYVDRKQMLSRRSHVMKSLGQLANKSEKDRIYIYDAFNEICPSTMKSCSTHITRGGIRITIYRDGDHLAKTGSLYLRNHFNEFIETIRKIRT